MVGEEIESFTLVQFVCFSDIRNILKKAWVKRTGVAKIPVVRIVEFQCCSPRVTTSPRAYVAFDVQI